MTEHPQVIPSRHLSDVALAAFIDGTLTENDRAAAASHLAVCAVCRAELVTTSALVASAAPGPRRARSWTWSYGAIAAAAAIVAIVTIPRTGFLETAAPALERRTADRSTALTTISPAEGASIDPLELVLAWREEEGASYRVTIADESGRTVWTTSTTAASARVPADVVLPAGARFYWYVDALTEDGSSLSSGPRSFSTVER